MHRIEDRLTEVRKQIQEAAHASARKPDDVRLLAVSKKQSIEKIQEAYALGLRDFGENYLQEAKDKQDTLSELDICWHFIGPIQSNKTKDIAEHFAWVHTVDRLKIAERLNAQRHQETPLNICIQVNIDREASKSGVAPDEVFELARSISTMPNLCLRGLMAIPKPEHDAVKQRDAFLRLRTLKNSIEQKLTIKLDTLSMGMSQDLTAAIAEGATIVRIGTAIFGERPVS
jgi:pyridoxal phosphate enzyme (YggS family)